ncbi:hypothetical protein TNCV_4789841 [Trichonephila clavipes]|nr:hypothetical protein TNCV_4789841 [Trichonephila clavipes]
MKEAAKSVESELERSGNGLSPDHRGALVRESEENITELLRLFKRTVLSNAPVWGGSFPTPRISAGVFGLWAEWCFSLGHQLSG